MCCNKEKIKVIHFECGHVISEFNDGTIYSQCNRFVGKKNMNKFMRNYRYLYPSNQIGKKCKLQQNKKHILADKYLKQKNTQNKQNTIKVIVIE